MICRHFGCFQASPPGTLSYCSGENEALAGTGVWHSQMNLDPPSHSWQPWSTELERRKKAKVAHLLNDNRRHQWVFCFKSSLPGLSGWIASRDENTLLIWPLVAWWVKPSRDHQRKNKEGTSGFVSDLYIPISCRRQPVRARAAHHPDYKKKKHDYLHFLLFCDCTQLMWSFLCKDWKTICVRILNFMLWRRSGVDSKPTHFIILCSGVPHGCVLSPLLFNLIRYDMTVLLNSAQTSSLNLVITKQWCDSGNILKECLTTLWLLETNIEKKKGFCYSLN